MTPLSLLHHVHDGSAYRSREELAAGWSITPAVGHPEVTEAMVAALRVHVLPQVRKPGTVLPTVWHHCDGNAWAAVTDLHRAGEHEEATALARLLRWCDSQFTRRNEGMWEIAREEVSR